MEGVFPSSHVRVYACRRPMLFGSDVWGSAHLCAHLTNTSIHQHNHKAFRTFHSHPHKSHKRQAVKERHNDQCLFPTHTCSRGRDTSERLYVCLSPCCVTPHYLSLILVPPHFAPQRCHTVKGRNTSQGHHGSRRAQSAVAVCVSICLSVCLSVAPTLRRQSTHHLTRPAHPIPCPPADPPALSSRQSASGRGTVKMATRS